MNICDFFVKGIYNIFCWDVLLLFCEGIYNSFCWEGVYYLFWASIFFVCNAAYNIYFAKRVYYLLWVIEYILHFVLEDTYCIFVWSIKHILCHEAIYFFVHGYMLHFVERAYTVSSACVTLPSENFFVRVYTYYIFQERSMN